MTIDVFAATLTWARTQNLPLWSAEVTGSTNAIAKDDDVAALRAPGPNLYIARAQTQGRGRSDHTWTTPPGHSLLSTWSFPLTRVPQPIFAALAGLALFSACSRVWPEAPFNLKAPNDLFLADRKTAGILIETVDQGAHKRTVIGLGLNVEAKPDSLSTATCLREYLGEKLHESSWKMLLTAWLEELRTAVRKGQEAKLDLQDCGRLKAALNRHPLLKEPVLEVDPLGQLRFASRTVYWHEL